MSRRHVTAVVLLSDSTTARSLSSSATAVAEQTRAPDRVVMVAPPSLDADAQARLDEVVTSGGIDEVLAIADPSNQATAVGHALALLEKPPRGEQEGEPWLWFVVDGSLPARDALAQQLELVAQAPSTSVVGPKRVRYSDVAAAAAGERPRSAEEADALVDVGITLTHSGRIITGVDPGELDQGQVDWRQDVLAVALPGMLIRERTLRRIGSPDPDLPSPWAEIDLCRRVWRSGERVAVQSAARLLFPDPVRPLLERLREQRTGQILVLIKHRAALAALATVLLLPLLTVARMGTAVAASVPRRALMELRAWGAAMRRTPRVLGRGLRERRQFRVPANRLAPLYLPRTQGLRRWVDDTWTRLFADDEHNRRIRRTTWGIAGTRHGGETADFGRHLVWSGVVALSSAVLGLIALRGLFGRGEITGPALLPLPAGWSETWEAAWSSWVPGGLGARGPAEPLVRLLGHLPLSGSLPLEIIVFTAIPLSALSAWWAAGAVTRAVGARLALVVAWALAPSLLTALSSGAWPLLLLHLLLPLLALAVAHAIGLPRKTGQASVSAAALGGLLLLVIGAIQPVTVLLIAVALALIAPVVPGRRPRLLWILLPSLALHAAYVPAYLGHPATLLHVGGVAPQPSSSTSAQLLLLWPASAGVEETLIPVLGTDLAPWAPVLPLVPVALAALAAPLLPGPAGRAGRFGVLMAGVVLLTVLLARQTVVEVVQGQPVPPPLGGLLSLLLLMLGVGAAAAFDTLARRERGDSRAWRLGTSLIAAVVAAVCVTAVGGWSLLLPGALELERAEGGQVPAAAADQGRTDARSRVLVIEEDADGTVEAGLVVHGGDSIVQHSAFAAARDADRVRAGAVIDEDPGSAALREAVASMLSGDVVTEDAEDSALAVGYVIVPGDQVEQAGVVAALDASPLLEKVTANASGGMWRVVDARARAVVTDGERTHPLSSTTVEASGEVPAAGSGQTLVLSERYDSRWRAEIDGSPLDPVVVDGWAQGFEIPAGAGGEAHIHREQPWRLPWQLTLYTVLALTILVAIPWRPRSRAAEDLYG